MIAVLSRLADKLISWEGLLTFLGVGLLLLWRRSGSRVARVWLTAVVAAYAVVSMPLVSYLATRTIGRSYKMFIPPSEYNPYNVYRQTTGAASGTGIEFEATGTYTSPKWVLPGLEGAPSMVSKITYLGDVDSGGTSGTAATATVTAGNMTGTFITGFADRAQVTDIQDSGDVFYKLQVTVTQTRNTGSTRWTPQSLPIIIEGYSWVPTLRAPSFGWYEDMS